MKVVAINGSARKDGNTAILINQVFDVLRKEDIETEMIQLAGQVIEPCKACWACGGQENCVHHKDSFREIFDSLFFYLFPSGICQQCPIEINNFLLKVPICISTIYLKKIKQEGK